MHQICIIEQDGFSIFCSYYPLFLFSLLESSRWWIINLKINPVYSQKLLYLILWKLILSNLLESPEKLVYSFFRSQRKFSNSLSMIFWGETRDNGESIRQAKKSSAAPSNKVKVICQFRYRTYKSSHDFEMLKVWEFHVSMKNTCNSLSLIKLFRRGVML